MKGIDDVEFRGFRLLRVEDNKRFQIRPNSKGYFYRDLPSGEYTLTRSRSDRPDHKEPKSIDILKFTVKPESLVNLGTIKIVVNGKPYEWLKLSKSAADGRYTYKYHYERIPGKQAADDPFNWFEDAKPKIVAEFNNSIYIVDTEPTQDKDGSEIRLRIQLEKR
jgi:hypothetical protein